MALFDFLKRSGTNDGVKEFQNTPGAVLLDVRTAREYAKGHIPKSVNLPLHRIDEAASVVADKTTPLFVYCLSGARSSEAETKLKAMGYVNVKNIGGISGYSGDLER